MFAAQASIRSLAVRANVTSTSSDIVCHRYMIAILAIILVGSLSILGPPAMATALEDNPSLSLVKDAAGLFNERGYLRSNSFSVDGNEVINDFNGNLIWSRTLDYLPMTQNGIHFDMKLTYNGSVGHTVRNCIGDGCGLANVENINSPEWIISVNNIAVQTFNFENEEILWETQGGVSENDDVALLINGYHTCYSYKPSVYSQDDYGTISILTGDGGVRQFYSIEHNLTFCQANIKFDAVIGEYRSFNKDDRGRGYLDCATGDFTLFEEDGSRIRFIMYRPQFSTVLTRFVPLRDSLVQFIPVEFLDHQGHSLKVWYDTLYAGGGERINGRPLVKYAGPYHFDWHGLLTQWPSMALTISKSADQFDIYFRGPSGGIGPWSSFNRGYVIRVVDAARNSTSFDYCYYKRTGTGLNDFNHGVDLETGNEFSIFCARLKSVTDPFGGIRHYTYYNDLQSKWQSSASLSDILNMDYDRVCLNPEIYPCQKTTHFDLIGRDPYYTNIVTARRRATANSVILAFDTLIFSWIDENERIDTADVFTSKRYYAPFPDSLLVGRRSDLTYRQFPKPGPYAQSDRDRGWELKLMTRGDYDGEGALIQRQDSYWDRTTFLMDSSVSVRDDIVTKSSVNYQWNGPRSLDTVNNILVKTSTDSWGISNVTEYVDDHFSVTSPSSVYFNSLVEDSKVKQGAEILSHEVFEYYDGSNGPGFLGQLENRITYPIVDGVEQDPLVSHFEYFNELSNWCLRAMDLGALRKEVNPNGDSVVYHYYEKILPPPGYVNPFGDDSVSNPIMYKYQWRGDSTDWSNQRILVPSGPFWYRREEFTNAASRLSVDTTYFPSECLTMVTANQNYEGVDVISDTIILVQPPIKCRLTMPGTSSGYCDWDAEGSVAKILKNGSVVDSIICEFARQDHIFYLPVDSGDVITAMVYHASTHGENYQAAFWHLTCQATIDTVINTAAYPGTIVDYQSVADDGRITKAINPNRFVTEIKYDPLDRVEQVTLPGNFEVTDPRFVSTPAEFHLTPVADATCFTDTVVTDDTILVAADSNLCPAPEGDVPCPRKRYYGGMGIELFEDLSQFGFDSAFIYFDVLDTNVIEGDAHPTMTARVLAKGVLDDPATLCPATLGAQVDVFEPSLGSHRINAETIFRILKDYDACRVYVTATYTIGPGEPLGPTDCFSMAIASSEHPDPSKRPRLEIFGKWYRDADSVFTVMYEYDDAQLDGDGIDITTNSRLDYENLPIAARLHFDDLARPFQRDALYSNGSAYASSVTRFDFLDRKVKSIDPLDMETAYTYDDLDRPLSTKSPNEQGVPTYARSQNYVKVMAGDLDFPENFNLADSQLLVTESINENGHRAWNSADILGRNRASITTPDGTSFLTTYLDYDNLGNLTKIIRPKGDTVLYWYNSLGWVLKEWSNDYDTISYSYDANGNVVAKHNGNQRVRSVSGPVYKSYYRYDGIDRMIESGEMSIAGEDTTFSTLRRLVYDQETTENGSGELSLSFSVNGLGNYGEEYHYDPRGRLKHQINYFNAGLDSTIAGGRFLYSLSGTPQTIGYSYNYADQITSITYPTGIVVTYEYDEFGRLAKVGDGISADKYAGLSYTMRDEVAQLELGEGLQTVDYVYNARGWLETINNGEMALGDLFAERLRYYASPSDVFFEPQFNGNIGSQEVFLPQTPNPYYSRYKYDEMDRLLTAASAPGYAEEAFEYDANGNRISYRQQWIDGPTPLPDLSTYTALTNQLASVQKGLDPAKLFSYDENGNVAWDERRNAQFAYDPLNQLSNVTFPLEGIDDDEINYGYSADGQRVFKRYKHYWQEECGGGGGEPIPDPESPPLIGSLWNRISFMMAVGEGGTGEWCTYSSESSVWYLVGNGKVLAEYTDPEGAPYRQYVYAGDKLVAIHSHTDGVQYVIADHLGSTRVVFDTAGTVRNAYLYTAFGADRPGSVVGTAQPMRYTGKILDGENGLDLYYYGSRYQAPDLGAFTQVDPQAGRTPGWSPYVYTLDNPMKYVDPDGEVVDYVIDAAAVGISTYEFVKDPSWSTGLWLGADVVCAIVPIIPAPGAIRHGAKITKLFNKADNVGDAANAAESAAKQASKLKGESKLAKGGKGSGDKIETHHELPRQFEPEFKKRELNIENYTKRMDKAKHRLKSGNGLHTGKNSWNKQWKNFFDKNPRATKEQVLEQLRRMRADRGIT